MVHSFLYRIYFLTTLSLASILIGSCSVEQDREEVVVYTSWDAPHSRPILALFEEQTGIKVEAVYDTEAAKTAGLVNRLIIEKRNPQADVFWNSEIVRTLVLKEKGILQPYKPKSWDRVPDSFKDSDAYWTGFAGRSRILLYNTELVSEPPRRLADLLDPKWKGKIAIANPLFGTTATDVSVWFSQWGPASATAFLSNLKANDVLIAAGNAMAKDMVVRGEAAICLTDTDDALGAMANGHPVEIVFLDQNLGEEGALLIPNTVCLIKGSPNPGNGKKLIEFLLSEEVASLLAHSRAGQIPLSSEVEPLPEPVAQWSGKRFKEVDFVNAHASLEEAMQYVREYFLD